MARTTRAGQYGITAIVCGFGCLILAISLAVGVGVPLAVGYAAIHYAQSEKK